MNLIKQSATKKEPKPGDIFVYLLKDGRYFYGRVIKDDAKMVSFKKLLLVYFYDVCTVDKIKEPDLDKKHLLMPPVLMKSQPWKDGYFVTIVNSPLNKDDVYDSHCFIKPNDKCYDEYNNPVDSPKGPIGFHRITLNSRGIDYHISKALKLPIEDE